MAKRPRSNIFISYGRKDAGDLAIQLRDDLQAVNHNVWLDLSEIPGGAVWSEKIEDAIEHCDVALILMSQASLESQWCRAEQLRALRLGKRVIPLLATKGAEPPLHLEHLNYLDFSDSRRYDDTFRDLLSDITSGQAFTLPAESPADADGKSSSPFKQRRPKQRSYSDEKRNAPSFRRFLKDLRASSWLGARFWWPYFLFHFTDMQQLIKILQDDELRSAFINGEDFNDRWDKFVRLYFRPRPPHVFHAEGFRPAAQPTPSVYTPMPVYLLFDLEAVVCHPDSRFSDGDPAKTKKTYKTPTFFREMPFDLIYHDSWFMPDEKDEILRFREAQVLMPERIGLEALQIIWLRSAAEYETLHTLLPDDIWRQWRDKITVRTDYHLFNNRRPFVQTASLLPEQICLRFNPCQREDDAGPFNARMTVETEHEGQTLSWQQKDFTPQDVIFDLPQNHESYTVHFWLDDALAYAGTFDAADDVL